MFSTLFSVFKGHHAIVDLENKKSEIEEQINSKSIKVVELENKTEKLQEELNKINIQLGEAKHNLNFTQGEILSEELCCYSFPNKETSSEELRKTLEDINASITKMIVDKSIIIPTKKYTVEGSDRKGQEFQKFYGENLVLGFNTYFDKKQKSVKRDTYAKTVELIKSNYAKMNKRASIIGASLNPDYLNLKLQSLKTLLDIKIVVAEEKAKLAEEKRQLREQEKLLEEAEKAKAKLAKERLMYEQNLATAMNEAQRKEFEDKLAEVDKRIADVDYRVNNAKAGYLYVTSTPAMPDYLKLGVTRRLNPLVRIAELSSASTPYPFVCHALVFSDNVFELESNIHHYFDNERVNKENLHKEFFKITPEQAIKTLKEEFNCEVHLLGEEESEEE